MARAASQEYVFVLPKKRGTRVEAAYIARSDLTIAEARRIHAAMMNAAANEETQIIRKALGDG
jgi:hypothetical protein